MLIVMVYSKKVFKSTHQIICHKECVVLDCSHNKSDLHKECFKLV